MTLDGELRESGAEETRALVTLERRGERAIVTMDEPERLNSLSVGLNLQLQERLSELAADPAVRALDHRAPPALAAAIPTLGGWSPSAAARHSRPISRISGGYTIRCRNGMIAAM
jgi:hypothetical protein